MTGTGKNLFSRLDASGASDLWLTRKKRRYIVREGCSFDVDDVEYIRITNASNKHKIRKIKIQKRRRKRKEKKKPQTTQMIPWTGNRGTKNEKTEGGDINMRGGKRVPRQVVPPVTSNRRSSLISAYRPHPHRIAIRSAQATQPTPPPEMRETPTQQEQEQKHNNHARAHCINTSM